MLAASMYSNIVETNMCGWSSALIKEVPLTIECQNQRPCHSSLRSESTSLSVAMPAHRFFAALRMTGTRTASRAK